MMVLSWFSFRILAFNKDQGYFFFRIPKLDNEKFQKKRIDIYGDCFAFNLDALHNYEYQNEKNLINNDYLIDLNEKEFLQKQIGVTGYYTMTREELDAEREKYHR